MLEENKALVRKFFRKANSEEKTPVDMCALGFTAHLAGYPAMDLQAFQQCCFQRRGSDDALSRFYGDPG
ncbi:MAG: hypothetical protein ACXADD_07150 [Candidatus Thorarchaeota archaeon]|jgi:hypothetical protein